LESLLRLIVRISTGLEHLNEGLVLRKVGQQPELESREVSLDEDSTVTGNEVPTKSLR
jgi:hypothetical protein